MIRPPPQGRDHSSRDDDRIPAAPTGKESMAPAGPDGQTALGRFAGTARHDRLLGRRARKSPGGVVIGIFTTKQVKQQGRSSS
jgi:hypothetical protein